MALDLTTLPEVLRLDALGAHRYQAPWERDEGATPGVVFGGQILAQMIAASAAEDDDAKEVKSIHAIFARPGDFGSPLEYVVDSMHKGRTFGSDAVTCFQRDKVMSRGLLLLNVDEPDVIRHTTVDMPDVPGPDDQSGRRDFRVFPGAEAFICGGVDTASSDQPVGPAAQNVWTRYPESYDSPVINQAILSWATDGFLIGTSMLPHAGVNEGQAHRTLSTGVVSHTINFHDRFDISEWLLLANQSIWAGRGRTYGICNIWTQDGRLVATYTQDNMVRSFGDDQGRASEHARRM